MIVDSMTDVMSADTTTGPATMTVVMRGLDTTTGEVEVMIDESEYKEHRTIRLDKNLFFDDLRRKSVPW